MKDQPGQQLSTAIGKDWRVGKEQTIRYQYFWTSESISSQISPITTEILETFSGPIVVYDPHPHTRKSL
jgi:hypothetical protein